MVWWLPEINFFGVEQICRPKNFSGLPTFPQQQKLFYESPKFNKLHLGKTWTEIVKLIFDDE
jgi:hypothetical protein